MAPWANDGGKGKVPRPDGPRPSGSGEHPSLSHEVGPAPRESHRGQKRDPMIGRTIAGRFRIKGVIARGGMGKVYHAEQEPLGRACAVKILNPKYDGEDDPEFQRRFFLEASTASKLTHANTVTIFDYGLDEDIYFIAMEYVAGRTLFRVLREDGPLPEARVAKIIAEVGRSLREAHGIGVIHRDMKPANVVLHESEEGDRLKVLDFGLVKHVEPGQAEDLTQQGLFMGSPKYMAPE
ncbi:MAG: serine/threonine protein kinase, partial [Myxococcales bacterium]|nr:serine/threonine protein kinase [Myxococcales bacterium]